MNAKLRPYKPTGYNKPASGVDMAFGSSGSKMLKKTAPVSRKKADPRYDGLPYNFPS